ncbi:DUF7002 family protein [Paenibacillus solisilvae]|uniref:DUF7002 family protein n=1 Tax=Paenibacillus solisilvae TaxID=2486751 RepID=A0ABW0W1B7_9BACL
MLDGIIMKITKSENRKSLFHFTRSDNLHAIAHFDALFAAGRIDHASRGNRRTSRKKIDHLGMNIILNSHLRIAESMFDPETTQEQFRAYIDQHVFFWPTLRYCQEMLAMYTRREPDESFAILEFDAFRLLLENADNVYLSKYDSGSSPRFPARCSYKKSLGMFLPLQAFESAAGSLVPTKPSEIKEILIQNEIAHLSRNLTSVYVPNAEEVPERWREIAKSIEAIRRT